MIDNKKELKISVKAVFRAKNKVMFHKSKDGVRDLPGGHIEFGETIIEALKRELMEEINFDLNNDPKLLHVWTYICKNKNIHRVYIVYLIDIGNNPKKFVHQEVNDMEFVWLKKEKVKEQCFLPEMENLLLKAFDI
ncbi:MAG: NUDIX hydrolase [bacterium]|nr:NUDIX hydrolase [bacterium]